MFSVSEKKRDTPESRKTNENKNYSCYNFGRTAKEVGNKVVFEKTNATPVESADDKNYQCYSVKHILDRSFECFANYLSANIVCHANLHLFRNKWVCSHKIYPNVISALIDMNSVVTTAVFGL